MWDSEYMRNSEKQRLEEIIMKCPKCDKEMKKGIIESRNNENLTPIFDCSYMRWYPEEYKGKIIKKDVVCLSHKAEGYYCDACKVVFAVFDDE